MAQTFHQVYDVAATFANNLGYDSIATENTVLEDIPCLGLRNLAIIAVGNTGSISAIKLYGSPDGVNYMAVTGFTPFAVSSGTMARGEATGVYQFLRVTTTGIGNVDIYLYAVQ